MSKPIGRLYKKAAETFDVAVDFSPWMTALDTIASATVTCASGATNVSGTYIGTVSNDGASQVGFVAKAGGTVGQYLITVTATTVGSDVWVADLYLIVS